MKELFFYTDFEQTLRKAIVRYKEKHGRTPTHLELRSKHLLDETKDIMGLILVTGTVPPQHFFLYYEDETIN